MGLDLTGFGSLFDFAGKVIDKIFPDPVKAQEAKLELFKLQQTGELAQLAADTDLAKGQIAVNAEEAKNANVFVSGWRPYLGWTLATGFGVQFVFGPLGEWACALAGHPARFPPMDTATMMPLLLGMLGLGGMRTVERIKGVNRT
jgi:hypothetical protein